ncbi:MAG: hypothetical protein IK020_08750 [Clostridiales bacterium]|nr:hypothetical protein [Clostridiales bacterium]
MNSEFFQNKKYLILLGINIFVVVVVILVLVFAKPFQSKKSPEITAPSTSITEPTKPQATDVNIPKSAELDRDAMAMYTDMPSLMGLRVVSEKTEDGKYYTAWRAELDMDFDGDGSIETINVSLDDHSESFYVLVNKDGNILDYVVPGTEFSYKSEYSAKACKGELRAYSIDIDSSDPYTEVAVEMPRDNWEETQTLVVRFDGSAIHASMVHGKITGVSNSGLIQFAFYDSVYGRHNLYRTYMITNDTDFLVAKTNYFFTNTNVERSSYLYNPNFDIECYNLSGDPVTIVSGSTFYWLRTDNETYVDVMTTDGDVYRLSISKEVIEYSSGPQTIYRLCGHYAADITTR